MGVFYVESPAMRQLQLKTGRGDFEHLVIHSSIIRPAANRYIREYIRRLHGAPYRPLHPALADVLSESYGIMVYQEHVVLATDRDLAIRIARRSEQNPVMLEIKAGAAHENGIAFYRFGHSLYLADEIPVQFISGPPLPKERQPKEEPQIRVMQTTTGSFMLTPERDPDLKRRARTKKRIGWKEETRQRRRKKDWR